MGDIHQPSGGIRSIHAWRRGRLPGQPGRLIGRTWELDTIRHLLVHDEVRLLTLWGPAGIGKTRLALAAAADPQVRAAFHEGVVFVDLAPVREAAQVMPAIAEAFGLADVPRPLLLERLESRLSDRQVLLVLDNLEHLLGFAPRLVPFLLKCPSLKVLATSRCALRLRWERAFPIAPLGVPHASVPNDAATALEYSGIVLFVERARAARPEFELTDANAAMVAELCVRLDGLPLALELAAARTKGLPLLVLLKRLEDRLRLLQSGAPDLPARQQTLRRALTWSYDLLEDEQRVVFARLSVFDGGCSPEAAEAVCGEAGLSSDALESLALLVHHSLVRLEEVAGGQARYSMLATIRDYAVEQLARSGEVEEIWRRHAEYYVGLVEEAELELSGVGQVAWLERLEREHANLRAALRWAVASGAVERGLRLAAGLWRYWVIRGHLTEGRSWLRQLLAVADAAEEGQAQAHGLAVAGWLAAAQGDYAEAARLHEQSLGVSRRLRDERGRAEALRGLGVLARYAGDLTTARAHLEQSLALCRATGFSTGLWRVVHDLGGLCLDEADLAGARGWFEQSLALRRELGDLRGIGLAQLGLGRVALGGGDVAEARRLLAEALDGFRQLGDQQSIASALEVFACLAARHGGTARALRLVGAADRLRIAAGARPEPAWQTDLDARQATARGALGHAACAAAHAAGKALGLDEAIQLCFEYQTSAHTFTCPETVVVNGCVEEFTRREREVVELAVRGWSNRQIATQLVISERTAEGHIHNILGKLQLGSRAQLVAWGARLGLVVDDNNDLPSAGRAV
jgi:predicted ATPase/DNA-binding CsgD family transcriptional regulator